MHAPDGIADLAVLVGQASTAGRKATNDDALALHVPEQPLLRTRGAVAAIADGVSGAEAGRVAAEACVLGFVSDYFSTPPLWSVPRSAQRVLDALNQWLHSDSAGQSSHLCTLSVLILRSRTAHLFQVGDSRIWRLRRGKLECLTSDHTRALGQRKYLTRAMGMDLRLDVDYRKDAIEVGDRYLLTTDGIHDVLSPARIQGILRAAADPDTVCRMLVDAALEQDADDNLSCQLIEVVSVPPAGASDALTVLSRLPFPPQLHRGMVVDGLRVERELHASSRSHLYLVTDPGSGEKLVLKAPSVNLVDDRDAAKRLALESWIGARVSHPNLVRILHPERPRSCLYYLMEYVDGISLEQWRAEHPDAPVQDVLLIVDQLLNGLRALHRADVIHADLKPANVMVRRDGMVKLIDLGSCHARGLVDVQVESPPLLGVRQYTAPELIEGAPPSEQSDLFAVAVVLHELVTGVLPWNGHYLPHLSRPLPPLTRHNRFAPAWLHDILCRGLDFEPRRRFVDAAEFRAALAGKQTEAAPHPVSKPGNPWKAISAVLFLALVLSHLPLF